MCPLTVTTSIAGALFSGWARKRLADLEKMKKALGPNSKTMIRKIEKRSTCIKAGLTRSRALVNVLLQSGQFSWQAAADRGSEKLFLPLRFQERTTAECALNGLDSALPEFSAKQTAALLPCVYAFVETVSVDSAPAEAKALQMRADDIDAECRKMKCSNNYVQWKTRCELHQLENTIKPTFKDFNMFR